VANPKTEPLFTLPSDVQKRLTDQKTDIDKARRAIEVMKSLGMDTKELEDKIDWAAKVRETLLKEFV